MAKTEWIWDELYTIDDIVKYEFKNCGYSDHVLKRVIKTLKRGKQTKDRLLNM